MKVPGRGATPGPPHLSRTHREAEGCVLTTANSGAGTHLGNHLFTDTNHDSRKLYLNPKPGLGVTFDPKKASFIMEITSNTKFPHLILKSTDEDIQNW